MKLTLYAEEADCTGSPEQWLSELAPEELSLETLFLSTVPQK